jgi:hypothetical protein
MFEEKYNSFIYLWIDIKKNKFYIGSHLGSDLDGYLFGGIDIKLEYRKRPLDFQREILSYHSVSTASEIREIEKEYLMYYDAENNDSFYNRTNESYGGFHKKSVQDRLNDIDTDGLNSFQRSSKKMVQTRIKNNSYKSAKIKEYETKKKNINNFNMIKSKISYSLIGSKWINKNGKSKYIKNVDLKEYLLDGWNIGRKIMISFEECMKICQDNNIKSIKEWQRVSNKFNAPYNPDRKFKDQWVSWVKFLGK